MKKNMALSVNSPLNSNLSNPMSCISKYFTAIAESISNVSTALKMPVEYLRRYFSCCVEHEVSISQTWLVVRAQLAFILTVFPIECSFLLRTAFAAWFLIAVLKCKNSGL